MRFPWQRADPRPERERDDEGPGLVEAERAQADACEAVADAHRRAPHVEQIVARLRELRAENHISDRLAEAVRNGYRQGGDGRAGGG